MLPLEAPTAPSFTLDFGAKFWAQKRGPPSFNGGALVAARIDAPGSGKLPFHPRLYLSSSILLSLPVPYAAFLLRQLTARLSIRWQSWRTRRFLSLFPHGLFFLTAIPLQ